MAEEMGIGNGKSQGEPRNNPVANPHKHAKGLQKVCGNGIEV